MQCLPSFALPYVCNMLILCTEGWTGFVDTEGFVDTVGFVDIGDLVDTVDFSSHGAD
jgi:hypothetical protein